MYLKTFCDSDLPTKGFKTQRADSASIGLCLPRRLKRNTIADKAIPVRKDALTGIVLLKGLSGFALHLFLMSMYAACQHNIPILSFITFSAPRIMSSMIAAAGSICFTMPAHSPAM